jgi:4-amino-4-deoxy-L-arabinose transferase-like glycosyltransferase
VLAYIAVKGEVRTLFSMEIAGGLLIVLAVAMPWYVAMVSRHGMPFVDRLFFHDMWQRALGHVHDTNEGDDTSFRYYVWQLGYALFPFATLLPVSVLAWVREPADGPAAGPLGAARVRPLLGDAHEVPPLHFPRRAPARDARGDLPRPLDGQVT